MVVVIIFVDIDYFVNVLVCMYLVVVVSVYVIFLNEGELDFFVYW